MLTSSTETFAARAAVTALTPRWWSGGDDEGDAAPVDDGEDAADAYCGTNWDTGTLRSAQRDPYGQQFRPHLFGI